MEINDSGAYRYPPTFALLTAPLAPIPEAVSTWTYRLACIGCVRYLVGSWRAVGLALGDFALRIGIGGVLVLIAIRARADWLAFTAAAIAVPTLWVARLAALAGVPRLALERWLSSAGSAADERGATRT